MTTTEKRTILTVKGFTNLTTANIDAFKGRMEQFLNDKKHKWFLHDTLGLTTTWKTGEKFDSFVGAMEDNADISACQEAYKLAFEIANINPKEIVFEPGSAAERDIGRAIDRRLEKEAVAAKAAEVNEVSEVTI